MAGVQITPPFPVFYDRDGKPLEDGYLWIGPEFMNPLSIQIPVFWDEALSIPALQPVRTLNGYPSRDGTPSNLFSSETLYSITVQNKNQAFVYHRASSATSTELESALADATDPTQGAALIGRATVVLDSVKDLLAAAQETDKAYSVSSYHPAGTAAAVLARAKGGGLFHWAPNVVKSLHNGGTVISPTVPWDGLPGNLENFLTGFGETDPGGAGCFIRVGVSYNHDITWFGADPSNTNDSTASIREAVLAAKGTGDTFQTPASGRVFCPNGHYKLSGLVNVFNGIFLDGESAGGVVFTQNNLTSNTIEYVDEVTGVDTPLTIKRLVISYESLATTAGVTGIKVHSSTAASPVLEDVLVFEANDGFSFLLTINAVLTRCYAVNCARDGFAWPESAGLFNSVAAVHGCYAAGCGGDGWSGSMIGSTLHSVAGDRCGVGFNMKLINCNFVGSAESFVSFGMQLTGSYSTSINLYATGAPNASAAIFLIDSQDLVFIGPVTEWSGGLNTFTMTTSGTTARITVVNQRMTSNGLGIYSDKSIITEVGQGMRVGDTPTNTTQPFECSFSGGTGAGGSTHTSGYRVGLGNGFGTSLEAWDAGSPRFGLYAWVNDVASSVFEGSSTSTDLLFNYDPVLVSPGNVKWRLVVSDAGALSTVLVP